MMLATLLAASLSFQMPAAPAIVAGTLFQPDTGPRVPSGLVDLRPKFEAGKKFRIKMSMRSEGTAPNLTALDIDKILDEPETTPPGKKPPAGPSPSAKPPKPGSRAPEEPKPQLTTTQDFLLIFDVKDAGTNRDSIVDVSFESIKATSEMGDEKHEFDSTKAIKPGTKPGSGTDPLAGFDDPLTAALRPLVGSKITLTVDPNGNIKDAKGGSEWSGLAGLLGGGSPGDLFRGIVSPTAAPGLVRVGQSWETRSSVKTGMLGEFQMATKSKLVSHRGDLARVDFQGAITPGSEGGPGDGTFQIKESSYQGHCDWDTRRGFLKSMSSDHRVRVDAGILGTVQQRQTVKVERFD